MRQITLHVGGMGCRSCVREVTALLRDVPGVVTVSADPGESRVRLSGSMRLDELLAVFAGTNFRPRLEGDSGGTAAGQPLP